MAQLRWCVGADGEARRAVGLYGLNRTEAMVENAAHFQKNATARGERTRGFRGESSCQSPADQGKGFP